MNLGKAVSLYAGIVSILLLAVAPLHAADEGARRIVKSDGIEIELFEYGKGPETLIMAAGNGRPAAQLGDLAKGIAATGTRVITYNYRSLGASTGQIDNLTLHDYANDVWRVASRRLARQAGSRAQCHSDRRGRGTVALSGNACPLRTLSRSHDAQG